MSYSFHRSKDGLKTHVCESCGWVTHLQICPACEAINDGAADSCTDCGRTLRAQHKAADFTDPFENRVALQPEKDSTITQSTRDSLSGLYPYSILSNRKAGPDATVLLPIQAPDPEPFTIHPSHASHADAIQIPDPEPSRPRLRNARLLIPLAGAGMAAAYFLMPILFNSEPTGVDVPMHARKTKPVEESRLPVTIVPASEIPKTVPNKPESAQPAETQEATQIAETPEKAQIADQPNSARVNNMPESAARQCADPLLALGLCNK